MVLSDFFHFWMNYRPFKYMYMCSRASGLNISRRNMKSCTLADRACWKKCVFQFFLPDLWAFLWVFFYTIIVNLFFDLDHASFNVGTFFAWIMALLTFFVFSITAKKNFFRYYLCFAVCVCMYVCQRDYSHTVQPRALKFSDMIPRVNS